MAVGGPNETGIRTIPPLVMLAGLVIAGAIEFIVPTSFGLPPTLRFLLGLLLIVLPIALVVRLFTSFREAGSEYDVRKKPGGLVTDGAFAWSRNPGYVAMFVAGIGVGLVFDTLWAAPAALGAMIVIRNRVVLKEEALLEETFGEAYVTYKARVRRWL